jgi:hypothetical protein
MQSAVAYFFMSIGFGVSIVLFLIVGMNLCFKRAASQHSRPPKKKDLSSLKTRMILQRMIEFEQEQDAFVGLIEDEDDIEAVVDKSIDEYVKRQSKHFMDCALNLMAHSYKNLDEAKADAVGLLEDAFGEDILKSAKKPEAPKADGDDEEDEGGISVGS